MPLKAGAGFAGIPGPTETNMTVIYRGHNNVAVFALEPGPQYSGPEGHEYVLMEMPENGRARDVAKVVFQKGPVPVNGVNGLTNEALLAILVHRLNVLNDAVPCRENSIAITHIESALLWLQRRTNTRIERGVEGKNEV